MEKNLSHINLKKDPYSSGYILDLKMTQISNFSNIFEKIKPSDITELILSYNSFPIIDPMISEMRNLRVLNISVNHLKAICNLEELHKLESLNLSTNRITMIENIQNLPKLIRLVVYTLKLNLSIYLGFGNELYLEM